MPENMSELDLTKPAEVPCDEYLVTVHAARTQADVSRRKKGVSQKRQIYLFVAFGEFKPLTRDWPKISGKEENLQPRVPTKQRGAKLWFEAKLRTNCSMTLFLASAIDTISQHNGLDRSNRRVDS